MMGAYLAYIAYSFLGWSAVFSAMFLCVLGVKLTGIDLGRRLLKHAAIAWALVFQVLMIFDISYVARGYLSLEVPDGSGILGQTVVELMLKLVGVVGTFIVLVAGMISTLVFYASISHRFRNLVNRVEEHLLSLISGAAVKTRPIVAQLWESVRFRNRAVIKGPDFKKELKKASRKRRKKINAEEGQLIDQSADPDDRVIVDRSDKAAGIGKPKRKIVLSGMGEAGKESAAATPPEISGENDSRTFVMPGLDLLHLPDQVKPAYDEKELPETARSLRETLETFGVKLDGNIEMYPGPIITRFEIKPAAGIKVNQISNLSEDLALNLRAKSIRIVAPIPGKAAIGIEIPNRNPQIVYAREILASEKFQKNGYELPLAFGKDISGRPYVTDLSEMPHLLIAGTTGSGKSVCINVIITSLIYSLHPDKLKFIFIDPKMLELSVYKGIPYLLEKVVTNPKQAERVLNDVVMEMEQRYKLLAGASVRNIVDYNKKQKSPDSRLPYIVIIIDELADLMMSTHSSRVELLITRLAQMARAVGIHLILATQRPSVDVITGLIKANFPSRIAFQVATKTDSRTILDGNGAERLLGKGDMLYLESGAPEPSRLHGAYISSGETEAIVSFIKNQPFSQIKEEEAESVAEERAQLRQLNDPVLLEAIETVIRQGQASVSLLQRKLGVGYQRAARIIDDLESMKIIGPYNESKAREVLVDKTFLANIKSGKIGKL
jgi:S-DNA-T family DNA segregation ATPase FtsK/SpoIIIE